MNVLIAEHHPLMRHSIRVMLSEMFTSARFVDVSSAQNAVETLASRDDFDLILYDLHMEGLHGLEAIQRMRAQKSREIPLVVISASEDQEDIVEVMSRGVNGYILKSSAPEIFKQALGIVLSGRPCVPSMLQQPAVSRFPEWSQSRVNRPFEDQKRPGNTVDEFKLTPRQKHVLDLIAAGLSNKEIARRLNVVEGTVKVHVQVILQKLGAKNRTQAARLAIEHGTTLPETPAIAQRNLRAIHGG